jgi:hypothetical protein
MGTSAEDYELAGQPIQFGPEEASPSTTEAVELSGSALLCFAGEATTFEKAQGTVHGAFATGVREATRILELEADTTAASALLGVIGG